MIFQRLAAGVLDVDECAACDVHCALPLVHHCASVYSFTVKIYGRPVGLGEDRNAYTHIQLKHTSLWLNSAEKHQTPDAAVWALTAQADRDVSKGSRATLDPQFTRL